MTGRARYYIVQAVIGLLLFVLGFVLHYFMQTTTSRFAMMMGATLCFSGLLSWVIIRFAHTKEEQREMSRQESIEANDERSVKIREKSGWITQKFMLVLLCVFVAVVTFILPFNMPVVVMGWGLLAANTFLPHIFTMVYAKQL